MRFPNSNEVDKARTLPQTVAQKRHFAVFANKTNIFIDKSLLYSFFNLYVETFGSSIVEKSGLSNGATMLVEHVTVQPNISPQINSPTSKSADFDVIPVVVPQTELAIKFIYHQ